MLKKIMRKLCLVILGKDCTNRLIWLTKCLLGKSYYYRRQLKCPIVKMGNYIIASLPYTSTKPMVVFSFGIGTNTTFDEAIIEKYNSVVYAFDPTPKAISYVQNKKSLCDNFIFFTYGLEAFDGMVKFHSPLPEESSGSIYDRDKFKDTALIEVQMKRLKTIVAELEIDHIDILKLDIEGSEFAAIDDILKSHINFSQLCVEFHERIFHDGKSKVKKSIESLRKHGYLCCYVSPNGEEATFINAASIKTITKCPDNTTQFHITII